MSKDQRSAVTFVTSLVTCVVMLFLMIQACYGDNHVAANMAACFHSPRGMSEEWLCFWMFALALSLVVFPHAVLLVAAFKMHPSNLGSWFLCLGTLALAAFGLFGAAMEAFAPNNIEPLGFALFVTAQFSAFLIILGIVGVTEDIMRRRNQSNSPA